LGLLGPPAATVAGAHSAKGAGPSPAQPAPPRLEGQEKKAGAQLRELGAVLRDAKSRLSAVVAADEMAAEPGEDHEAGSASIPELDATSATSDAPGPPTAPNPRRGPRCPEAGRLAGVVSPRAPRCPGAGIHLGDLPLRIDLQIGRAGSHLRALHSAGAVPLLNVSPPPVQGQDRE
jgi:hypothetical protein